MKKALLLPEEKQKSIQSFLPQDVVIKKLSNFFSAFADPTRMKILSALSITNMCVSDISAILKINQTTVSHQLKYLKQNGAVDCFRDGKIIYYLISNENINNVLSSGVDCVIDA